MRHAPAHDGTFQFQRLTSEAGRTISLHIDGRPCRAHEGDTVLSALLTSRRCARRFEFSGDPRAGFCLMGACQDCWVHLETGEPVRACTAYVEPGMRLVTDPSGIRP